MLIRLYGGYPEGCSYSILLMNVFTPFIDRLTKPRLFGALKKAKAAKVDESIPSTTYETLDNTVLSISYPNNFNPSMPTPKGEVIFMLTLSG